MQVAISSTDDNLFPIGTAIVLQTQRWSQCRIEQSDGFNGVTKLYTVLVELLV